jgi:predicted ribonuclease toxin of YeeF-YezG toxin-antitoxin module
MGLSDVKVITISDEVALDADGISEATSVGNNAALTIGGDLHSGGTVTNASGRQVTILSAGNDSSKSFTVVGTDVNGDALTEAVTGANAGTATSSGFFKTITSITAVGNPAGNVSAGINNSAADVIFAGRVRLKGFSIVSGGTAGTIEFKNTSPAGTTLFKARTIGTDNTTIDRTIPSEGVLFDAGMYVTYTVGTIDMMTFFYA